MDACLIVVYLISCLADSGLIILLFFFYIGRDEFQDGLETLYDNDWLSVTDLHDRDAC